MKKTPSPQPSPAMREREGPAHSGRERVLHMAWPYELKVRVYYEDTDAAGIVYHASYLRFAERGRTEMLRDAGFDHAQIFKETGLGFAVVAMNINYRAPAKL